MFGFFEKKQFHLIIDDNPPIQLNPKETVLNGAVRSNINFPHSCRVGGCAACKCKLISGKVKELTDKSYLLSQEEMDQNMILGCQSIPKSDVVVQLPYSELQQQECVGTITEQRQLTHDIAEVIVALNTPINYTPGQFAKLSAIAKPYPERSYSYAHPCDAGGSSSIAFFVRAIPNGNMSNWLLSDAAIGSELAVKGSFGDFYLRETMAPMVCIAGGSGLAPLIAILEHALTHTNQQLVKREVLLLMGARSQRDLYYTQQIEAIQSQWHGAFTYQAVLSDEPKNSNWSGHRGLVTNLLNTHFPADTEGYFCGPPPMIDAAINAMRAQGIPLEKLFFDKFSDQTN